MSYQSKLNTYLTEYQGYAQAYINARDLEEAEDWLLHYIDEGLLPEGTKILGTRWKQFDTVTGKVEFLANEADREDRI